MTLEVLELRKDGQEEGGREGGKREGGQEGGGKEGGREGGRERRKISISALYCMTNCLPILIYDDVIITSSIQMPSLRQGEGLH